MISESSAQFLGQQKISIYVDVCKCLRGGSTRSKSNTEISSPSSTSTSTWRPLNEHELLLKSTYLSCDTTVESLKVSTGLERTKYLWLIFVKQLLFVITNSVIFYLFLQQLLSFCLLHLQAIIINVSYFIFYFPYFFYSLFFYFLFLFFLFFFVFLFFF